eukprot:Awhi_evm1s11684
MHYLTFVSNVEKFVESESVTVKFVFGLGHVVEISIHNGAAEMCAKFFLLQVAVVVEGLSVPISFVFPLFRNGVEPAEVVVAEALSLVFAVASYIGAEVVVEIEFEVEAFDFFVVVVVVEKKTFFSYQCVEFLVVDFVDSFDDWSEWNSPNHFLHMMTSSPSLFL